MNLGWYKSVVQICCWHSIVSNLLNYLQKGTLQKGEKISSIKSKPFYNIYWHPGKRLFKFL